MVVIELHQLTKRYGATLAVDAVTLQVGRGELYGFLGPNGAGKTTTIRMMMGLVQPTTGRIVLGGHDLAAEPLAAKRLCGFVPDRPQVYEKLTGAEFVDFVAGLYQVPAGEARSRREELLRLFDLTEWATELIESYSHGMKQRLVLAAALVHGPQLLIVDEPMVGLDPRGGRLLKRLFRQFARAGVTVFMSTHSMEVAEETCDRIGIIHRGQLIAEGTVDALRRQAGSQANAKLEAVFLKLTEADDEPGIRRSARG